MNLKLIGVIVLIVAFAGCGVVISALQGRVESLSKAVAEAQAETQRVSEYAEHNAEIARRTMEARDALEEALEARAARDAEAAKKWSAMERKLKEALRNDPNVRDWYATPIPLDVDRMLRKDGVRPEGGT